MGLANSRHAVAETKLDFSTAWPDGNFHTENAKTFAEEVAKTTGGDVIINVRSGGQLDLLTSWPEGNHVESMVFSGLDP